MREDQISPDRLLERVQPPDYVDEWTEILSHKKEVGLSSKPISVIIFRLSSEWLALPTSLFKEIKVQESIHGVPWKKTDIIQGLVNVRGRLRVCIRLQGVLGIETKDLQEQKKSTIYRRLAVLEEGRDVWVFSADEVYGIYHVPGEMMEKVPVTVSKSIANYLKGIFRWGDVRVGFLAPDRLFETFSRSIL